MIEDGDPASGTFKTIKNICLTASAALPTSGKYMQGLFVRDSSGSIKLG